MSSGTSFLHFPPELRNIVYRQVFETTRLEVAIDEQGNADRAFNHVSGLRRACKQVNGEIREFAARKIEKVVLKPCLATTPFGGKLPVSLFNLAGWLTKSNAWPIAFPRRLDVTIEMGELDIMQLTDRDRWEEEMARVVDAIPSEAIRDDNLCSDNTRIDLHIDITLLVDRAKPIRLLIPMSEPLLEPGDSHDVKLRKHVEPALSAARCDGQNYGAAERLKLCARLQLAQYSLPLGLSAIFSIANHVRNGHGRRTVKEVKEKLKARKGGGT